MRMAVRTCHLSMYSADHSPAARVGSRGVICSHEPVRIYIVELLVECGGYDDGACQGWNT